nr:probable membrane-associated kinase regulator 1 [Ipomoea batatas]
MGENGCEEEEWMLSNLVENQKVTENEEEEEEEEALSLCDLPNKEENNQSKKESPGACGGESQEDDDFDFFWRGGSSSFKESEMCAADEVFFQGQILPLRHSISSDAASFKNNGGRCHSFRYTSSRCSSVRSLRSSSSGSSSTSTATTTTIHSKYYNKNSKKQQPNIIRNQSTPQVRFSQVVSNNNNCSSRKSITLWSLFRAGLVSTPEIDFQDLKIRQHKPFGSRNSSNNNNTDAKVSVKRNLKQRFSDKNMILFGGACSCSVNDVRTVPPRTATTVGRNSSAREAHEDKNSETTKVMRKQSMSRRLRTFEWLKQLSLEGPATTTTL